MARVITLTKEQIIFPEIDTIRSMRKGMNITVVTTAKTDEKLEPARHFGMPFK